MKTPMQELIEQLKQKIENQVQFIDEFEYGEVQGLETALYLAEHMLNKEKEVMCEFAKLDDDDLSYDIVRTREELFNIIFNTNEK